MRLPLLSSSLRARRPAPARPGQRGVTLLEVLVSILIFSFGILGLVGLQARATQYSIDAEDRSRAALLADDLAAQMRLARRVNLPTQQIDDWRTRVTDTVRAGLPNAAITVTPDVPNNTALITITWRPPRQAVGNESRLVTEVVLTNEEIG
ncbi:MAG TPA: type IV pilus modification protein PilV [Methylibium sp.]|uniref:type IV pilus modification protein PilV n=1 Tax=Methylibium sp. TaxID=2067992 RepID=UPI002DBA0F9C|nr:type IV pilus modification protein PilV [Methylibium sp.]HEU4460941.1 type IV pilus modification protein PilV [Methylibium sp.]